MATTHEIIKNVVERGFSALDAKIALGLLKEVQIALPNVAYATADQNVAGTSLAASTYLAIANGVGFNGGYAVLGGRTYSIDCYIACSVGTSGGIKVALDGGTATATNVQLTYEHLTASAIAVTDSAALATTAGAATTGVIAVRIRGSFVATGSGSLVLRFSEFASVTQATVKKGSWLALTEIAQ